MFAYVIAVVAFTSSTSFQIISSENLMLFFPTCLHVMFACITKIRAFKKKQDLKTNADPLLQTTLCNTALDNPTQRTTDQMINAALKFLETDTVW